MGEVGLCSTAVDRFSCSNGCRWVDMVVVAVRADRGIQVNQEVPSVPLVPCIREDQEILDIREVRVVPCIQVVQGVLAWGKVRGTGVVVEVVVVAAAAEGHNTMGCM